MRKISSRNQIRIKEVKDGVLVLPGNKYRMILETSAINFELKSDEEQDAIIDNFQHFLNALPCTVQFLVRIREVDIDGYLDRFLKENNHETQKVYKNQLNDYAAFIKKLVAGNKIMSRKFYIVISYKHTDHKNDFPLVKGQLNLSADIISKNLERLGMKSRILGNFEILELFYDIYNFSHIKSQPLSRNYLDALSRNSYGI